MSVPDSPVSGGLRWAPTHVQVTVLRARGLRSKAKGGAGGSDAYAVMALGKEKFATSVAERCLGSPVWREEATFELPPPPRRTLSGAGEGPGPIAVLQLTVFHRALLGLDKFLGRAEISLAELQSEGGRRATRWYQLHSKPGKKEKERGEIEVDIQFMRSNMTASMFDLSMKDKSRSPFGKLKDKLKGKRGNGLPDTASAIVPSITHSLADSDEESNEKEKKKSKLKTLFSKHGLQKGNISQSMSVLPTLQPVSERVRLRPSDFQSQWGDDDDDDTLTPVSEKPSINRVEDNVLYPSSGMTHKRTGSADSKQLNQITSSNTKKDAHSLFGGLKPKNDPASRSNVCINGSHVYMEVHESKSDIIPKDHNLSSPSPQAFKRKQLSLSQENLSSEISKEPEITGRVPLDSSSLESFKAMTLPSYKLLSGGDLLESSIPVSLDTAKETKENKKQENKKSALLSLVTGKKEPKTNEEAGNGADVSLKLKEAKCNEKELVKKETPFGVPADCKRDRVPDKNSAAVIPVAKTSLNPFSEDIVEERKSEKSAASVKPSQTKPVKPRLDVSSEDETKAILTIPVSPSASSFCPSHHSSDDDPFISKLGSELKVQDSNGSASPSLNLPTQPNNNPFSLKWGQETKEQDPKYFTASFCLPSPPSCSENNPFASKRVQESQLEDSEHSSKSPLYFLHPPITSVLELHTLPSQLSNVDDSFKLGKDSECVNSPPTSLNFPSAVCGQDNTSSIGNIRVVSSEELQNEIIANQTDVISSFPGSLSAIHPESSYGKVGLIRKTQHEDKVNIVTPFKESNGSVKKSVTFALDELKDDSASSGNEDSDEDPDVRWHDENEDAIDPTISNRQRFELNIKHCSFSKPNDGRIHSVQISGNSLERETETSSSIRVEPPVPTPRVLVSSPKETQLSGTVLSNSSLSVPPKPAPRSALKHPKHVSFPLTDEPKIEDTTNSASELASLAQNSVLSSEKLIGTNSLTISVPTTLHLGRDDDTFEKVQDINNDNTKYAISIQYSTSGTGELNQKLALPVILEVGSDDEQLSDYQKDAENMTVCEDLSRTEDCYSELRSSVEERGRVSDKEATHVSQTLSLINKVAALSDAFESNKSLVDTSGVMQNASHNIRGTEQNNEDRFKESRQGDCPGFSNKAVSLSPVSSSSELYSASSLQSETLSSNRAESPRKATAEGLDAKVEISGKKKLLQAWVSPSETHSNQTLQSGGTYSAKLRLHPVKPMNATNNKSPAKTLNIATKILDDQNETSLKKYNPSDPAYAYAQLTHDELIQLVLKQKDTISKRDFQVRELEDYIDNLLVRVMEETPNILRVQAHANKKAGKM